MPGDLGLLILLSIIVGLFVIGLLNLFAWIGLFRKRCQRFVRKYNVAYFWTRLCHGRRNATFSSTAIHTPNRGVSPTASRTLYRVFNRPNRPAPMDVERRSGSGSGMQYTEDIAEIPLHTLPAIQRVSTLHLNTQARPEDGQFVIVSLDDDDSDVKADNARGRASNRGSQWPLRN